MDPIEEMRQAEAFVASPEDNENPFMAKPQPVPRGMPILRPLYSAAGLRTPHERAIATSACVAAGLFIVRPGFAFSSGRSRPFKAFSNDPNATWTPWWLIAGGIGLLPALFT